MRTPSMKSVLAQVLLAGGALAQLITTTLPYVDGDTLVISVSTNPAGIPVTTTVRTVTTGLVVTTPIGISSSSSSSRALAVPLTSSSSSSSRSTSRSVAATAVSASASTPRVGQDTALPPPMRTTTYNYDTGNGYWTVATWTASVTAAPTVATVVVPAGTQQAYDQYQTSVNSNVLASAQASASRGAGQARAVVGDNAAILGWAIMGVGAVLGAGLAL